MCGWLSPERASDGGGMVARLLDDKTWKGERQSWIRLLTKLVSGADETGCAIPYRHSSSALHYRQLFSLASLAKTSTSSQAVTLVRSASPSSRGRRARFLLPLVFPTIPPHTHNFLSSGGYANKPYKTEDTGYPPPILTISIGTSPSGTNPAKTNTLTAQRIPQMKSSRPFTFTGIRWRKHSAETSSQP